jgi:hypothetical protein
MEPEEFQRELNMATDRGEDFEGWIRAFCGRKWNSDFSIEMSRSVKAMMDQWENKEQQTDEA